MGAGAAVAPKQAASAEGTAISKSFTAILKQNNSKIFTSEADDSMTMASTGPISAAGEYTISAEATDDVDDMATESQAIWITIDMGDAAPALPTDFTVLQRPLPYREER